MIDGAAQRTVDSDGVRLAAVEAGDPAAPTIVLVHGYPDTKELWDEVLVRLAPRFHVVAYDVRGAGASSAPRGPAAYDFKLLGADLEAVVAATAPGARVHLVGHDWGGIQGWEFATLARFEGKLASLTAVAGPSLDQIALSGRGRLRHREIRSTLRRARRSWYVLLLCAPGGPTLFWRVLGSRASWERYLRHVERVPVDADHPGPTLIADGLHGANLYRQNVTRRMLMPRRSAHAHVPVQLIVPSGDRYIPPGYYEPAERFAPLLRRRVVGGSHWVPRSHPELVARWVDSFVSEVESGSLQPGRRPWRRGGGVEQLVGRLALVTGAGSGIGRATARALASQGMRLLLVDRDASTVAATAELIPGSRAFECDVGDQAAMEQLAATVIASHGVPDVVVNNAGIAVSGPFLDTGFDHWRRVLDVNLMGVVHGCRLFGRALVERGEGGQIVNTASAAAFQPTRELPAYAASKAGVLMLSECLRAELVPFGIGVTAVCPGFVATNITRAATYVGRGAEDQERARESATRLYQRRNFTPERVANEIVAAIAADTPVAIVTPEAKVMRALARFAPGLLRRLAGLETLPI